MSDEPKLKKSRSHSEITRSELFNHGKLPPQAVDLEEIVLGAMMIESDCIDRVATVLRPEVFYKEAHQIISSAIFELYRQNKPIDILTISNQLRHTGELELVGGPYYISQLTNRVASSANVEYHSQIILEKFVKRELIRTASDTIREAYEETTDVFQLIDTADKSFQSINETIYSSGNMHHIAVSLDKAESAAKIREQKNKEGKTPGIRSGLHAIDSVTGGWINGDLIIIAARPAMGKTAFMLHCAKYAAKLGHPVCLYSLEMTDISLTNRMIISESGIDATDFKLGKMDPELWKRFYEAKKSLAKLPIYIDDNPICSMKYIRANSKIMKKKGLCDLIMVDYLQLADMEDKDKPYRNREQDVSKASRDAKITAKILDVPFILLSQLNRGVESRGDKKPGLADLRESGAIEQDANMVCFLYRPAYYGIEADEKGESTFGIGNFIVAKDREGSNFTAKFGHNESLTRFYDLNSNVYNNPVNDIISNIIKPNQNFLNQPEETKLPF